MHHHGTVQVEHVLIQELVTAFIVLNSNALIIATLPQHGTAPTVVQTREHVLIQVMVLEIIRILFHVNNHVLENLIIVLDQVLHV